MAGAVSAGAYTAGVIDFLLQALEDWYAAKERGDDVPQHHVEIKVLSGASAGGMTAAMAAALARGKRPPVAENPAADGRNTLYTSWVEQITAKRLLDHKDLEQSSRVASLLDSTVLDEIAETAFSPTPEAQYRPYLADPLHVHLSVANLVGVPYNIGFHGDATPGHGLRLHADQMHFAVGDDPSETPGAQYLPAGDLQDERWSLLKDAAVASGAFPIGLASRMLARPAGDYSHWKWTLPREHPRTLNGEHVCQEECEIEPNWTLNPDEVYNFLSVDGGLMDNEPLELARQELSGAPSSRNPRNPGEARRAVILIDPFPNPAEVRPAPSTSVDMITVAGRIFGALKEQARFKPAELALAADDDVYSRFMIAPSREEANGERSPYPLASGSVRAFGGFLDESFRRHDFFLGRRNCQHFLRRWLTIPEDAGNPVLTGWMDDDTLKSAYGVRTEGSEPRRLPLIPLVGRSAEPEPKPIWPTYSAEALKQLESQVAERLDRLVPALIDEYLGGSSKKNSRYRRIRDWTVKRTARWVWSRQKRPIVERLMRTVAEDLVKRNLMSEPSKRTR